MTVDLARSVAARRRVSPMARVQSLASFMRAALLRQWAMRRLRLDPDEAPPWLRYDLGLDDPETCRRRLKDAKDGRNESGRAL